MEDKKIINEIDAVKILEELKQNNNLTFLEELLKDNQIEFIIEDCTYRVRLLNLHEKEILNNMKIKKFMQLLQDKDILLEKDLIIIYKQRGVDIEDLDEKLRKLEAEKKLIALKLGESIANKRDEKVLEVHRNQIRDLSDKINMIIIQKNDLLSYSLENQLSNYYVKCLTYLSLEKKIEDKWVKLASSLEEFEKTINEIIIEKAIYYSMLLN